MIIDKNILRNKYNCHEHIFKAGELYKKELIFISYTNFIIDCIVVALLATACTTNPEYVHHGICFSALNFYRSVTLLLKL